MVRPGDSTFDPAHPPLSAGERVALGIVASALFHGLLYFAIRPQPAAKPAVRAPLSVTLAPTLPPEAIRPAVIDRPAPMQQPVPLRTDEASAANSQSSSPAPAGDEEPSQPGLEESPTTPSPAPPTPSPAPPTPSPAPAPPTQEATSASAFQGEPSALPGLSVPIVEDPTYYSARQLDASAAPTQPIEPEYPVKAAERNVTGRVVLLLLIDEKGEVRDASVVSADPEGWGFEDAALKAFERQKFSPAVKNGHAVKSRFLLRVTFELRDVGRLR